MAMRSRSKIRLWKFPLLFFLWALVVWNVELVASQGEGGMVKTGDDVKGTTAPTPVPKEDVKPTIPKENVKNTTTPQEDLKPAGPKEEVNSGADTAGGTIPVDLVDLNPKGNCSAEIKKFCNLKTGSALDCITAKIHSQEEGNKPADDGDVVSEACVREWRELKVSHYRDITLDKKIEAACKNDIESNCRDHRGREGGDLACLRDLKENLSQPCQDVVFAAEQDAAFDFKMDPLLSHYCNDDAAKLCKGVKPGGGRIQACLRNPTQELSYLCKAELFRQEHENADDFRLNPELFKACVDDQKKFCPKIRPGGARVKDCLEGYRLDLGFSKTCKTEFDKMIARRSADFRLNPTLKKKCQNDIVSTCEMEFEEYAPNGNTGMIHCLEDFRENLKSDECKTEIHKVLALAAEDYRFDKEFSDACEANKQKLCKDVKPDQVLSCLQGKREELDNKCRAAVFKMEWRLSGDIDYKFAMKQACVIETGKFCKGAHHDRGEIIECLQGRVDDQDMGAECRAEVVADHEAAAKDYRLNYRIYKHCNEDVETLCPVSKSCKTKEQPCGGVVLQCLQEKINQLSSADCKKDIIKFEIKESKNYALNIPLLKACTPDLTKFCPRRKDHYKALACLRKHRNQLTNECRSEELRFSMMEASDIRLTPDLMNACGAELNTLCPNASPTNGEAFKCLQLNLESINMGVPCKVEVDLQGARQASDYRLDVRVRTECKEDVNKFCSNAVGSDEDGHAPVLRCFVSQYRNLSGGCQTEVAYAARMALFQYKLGSNLTLPCDPVVKQKCQPENEKEIKGVYIGAFMQCLFSQPRIMNRPCRQLVRVASRPGVFLSNNTDADIAATLIKYNELIGGNDLGQSGYGLFWVTTVIAFAAVLAVFLFRRYSGPPKTYTLVVKGGDL